ncbi:E3 ubiquitin-protein ligase UPL1-like isoform X2 [Typha angustifolia]|uniref:E3 ubiquitin-protein ligase UPL1-like isoform X2 n=1 Tax=Typha angustifolia TaxID=59011 RepID=UPI003C2B3BC3
MKIKRKRALEVPPNIRCFINTVISAALENIEEPLKTFVWEFDKGDFHHWIDLFNHFDSFFEKFIKPRKDLQLEDNFPDVDPPFPREAVLQILRVTRIILENCTNRHFYSSFEHLSSLLASTDADVIEATLQTLMAFVKKTVGKSCIRDASLTSKLFAFSQGWGGKEEGLGLIACCLLNGCDTTAVEIGSTLHFEFYAVGDRANHSNDTEYVNQGLQVIHIPNIGCYTENDLELLYKLVKEHNVPQNLRFSLLTRLRFARAFGSLKDRHQFMCIRLYSFIVLVQASHDADDMTAFFNNEPEFINELLSLLSYEDDIPERIRILGVLSLVAVCQDRSRQPTVLSSVTAGGHRGILPSLMQKAVDSITSGSTKWSIVFAEALLSLVSILVSSTPGSLALQEAGFIPTILPLLKDTNPQHLHLVSTAVHVIEGFLDYHNPSSALFRDLGGLDDTIARLKVEVLQVEKGSKNSGEEAQHDSKGKQVLGSLSALDIQTLYSEAMISYHRKLLMKALLRTISLANYVPGSSARVDGSEESVLPPCLCIIFRRAKDFGGGVFSLAANVMSDLIHKDPTCFPVLDAADLPRAFLDAIMSGVLCNSDAVTCIPQCLDALCVNSSGLQLVRDSNALRCFVKIFTSRSYLRALGGETTGALSNGLDELMRHASSLRASGVDMLIEILTTISKIGSGSECSTKDSQSSCPVPMEMDGEERSIPHGELSKVGSSVQMIEAPLDGTTVTIESFLPECISNAARLLETILQNSDTCRIFVEKKGIEEVLKLLTLQSMPISVSIGQSISIAFKNFSPQHSVSLARAVCSFIREHLRLTNELMGSVSGTKLSDTGPAKQLDILKCLSGLEGLLSLANFLLKGTSTIVSELAAGEADILKELGKVYKEMTWQISLSSDSKVDEKQDTYQETGTGDTSASSVIGRESDDDGNVVPVVRYMNPVSIRNTSVSPWNLEPDFVSVARSAGSMHRHGRHAFSRIRGGRLSRQLDASLTDTEGSIYTVENSQIQDTGKRSPDALVSDVLTKLGFAMRSFLASLVKGLPARRRADSNLSPASRSLVTALAQLFLYALSYSGNCTAGFEMSLSVKCRYLGKVVEDMAALIFDSRRRACNTALVNSFYVNGTFKELLTTFEATSQLLWTLPFSFSTAGPDQGTSVDEKKVCHSPWLLDTLQSYCRLLEYHVNSSLLLSPSPSQGQLLVQPVTTELSINLFPVPRDPEVFVRILQSQVLEAVLPVWNHSMFPNCSPGLITSLVSIINHIYSGVGDLRRGRSGLVNTNQRLTTPPLDESTISTIVEMGFTRARAEEALRSVGTNSVEMATDWLFSHPEEYVQEDVQLAQALALSLGNSMETSKEDATCKTENAFSEERVVDAPPLDDILAASMKLFRSSDSVAFPLTDLLVTLCNRNKGEDRPRVALYLVQQLKLCPSDSSNDTGALYYISHILALLLTEDSSTREIAAENGVIPVVLDILTNFRLRNESTNEGSSTKALSALLLIIDNMLQPKPKFNSENSEGSSRSLSDSSGLDLSLANPSPIIEKKPATVDLEKESSNVFEKILGKSTGYLTLDESQRMLKISCELIKQHVPAVVMQAVLQLCARLTKTHAIATQFLESGGLPALFSLPRTCIFPGFDSLASAIIRHLIEDPHTLQTAMEFEIRQTLMGSLSRHAGRLSPRLFLTSMASVISRDPSVFMRAADAVCQIDLSGGRTNVVLLKDKERDKDKVRTSCTESGMPSNEPLQMPESKTNDTPSKCSRGHKRVPASLSQVIDQLLEIVMSFPSSKKHEDYSNSSTVMEIDEPNTKQKGKSKVDEIQKMDTDISERSAWLAKLTFVLKLMSEILLMYVHSVGILLRRDMEICQLRGCGQSGGSGQGGIVHHILHQLLPLSPGKSAEASDEWKEKLSEKASWFLVVLCGRSTEGRRRVILEIVKSFSSLLDSAGNSSKGSLIPEKKVMAFANLVNSILSRNSSSNSLPGVGCSPDIAKAMLDGGMVQSLSGLLQVIDLDHPDAPKVVNLILKALESLTRAANAGDQVLKLDGFSKRRSTGSLGRTEDHTNAGDETANHDQITNHQQQNDNIIQGATEHVQELSHNARDQDVSHDQSTEHDMRVEGAANVDADVPVEQGVEFMREEIDEGNVIPNANEVGLAFRVEHRADDDMVEEDDEDVGDEGEDDEEDDDEDDDEDIAEEAAGMMSLADTDVEDHDDNGIADEYNDDMLDEEDEDFPENRFIEVRWREGLGGLDHLRVSRGHGDGSGFIDIAAESFQGVDAEDIYHLHRPFGIERRRQSGSRSFLDRSRFDGNAFPHPLLVRPSQSGELVSSLWSSNVTSSRDLDALSFGNLDVAHFYMLDAGLPSDVAASMFGDRLVGAAPPPLIDFSLGMDSLHIGGRRGSGDNRWTDDGQPQAGSHAAAIAQAVEEQFVSQLRGLTSDDNHLLQRLSEKPGEATNQQLTSLNADNQAPIVADIPSQPSGSLHQEPETCVVLQQQSIPLNGASCIPELPNEIIDAQSVAVPAENQDRPDIRQVLPDDLNIVHNGSETVYNDRQGDEIGPSEQAGSLSEIAISTDHPMEDSSEPAHVQNTEFGNDIGDPPSGLDSYSSCHALISSGNALPELSDAHAGSAFASADVDMDGVDVGIENSVPASNMNDSSAEQTEGIPQETNLADQANVNNEASSANEIDPTFLEALPEDLRAEVLASQQASQQTSQQNNTAQTAYAPPTVEEIDPEFLAALPPDIQAEVLAQQRAQRTIRSQQAEGQPVDMDNASIIATFPPDLREEVLLTSSEAVLSALPSALLAEAQMLRDREFSRYHARGSLFGGSHRLGNRRLAVDRQTVMDRGVGVTIGRRIVSAAAGSSKGKEVEGIPLLDSNSLKALIRLLRLAQPLNKGLLQRLLLNLCAHSLTRSILVGLLIDMIRSEVDGSGGSSTMILQRLYGCQWNVVYARPQSSDGLPPLVSRRLLEILTYLASNHSSVADILFYFDPPSTSNSPSTIDTEITRVDKGKENIFETKSSLGVLEASSKYRTPLLLFLKLLSTPLFLRSSAHLEQVMCLLQVVVNNAVSKFDSLNHSGPVNSETQLENEAPSHIPSDSSTHEQIPNQEVSQSSNSELPSSGAKRSLNLSDILLELPESYLCNLCSILALEGLSDKVYSLAAEVVKKLASVAAFHRKFFSLELASLARSLSSSAVKELVTLRNTQMLGLSSCSMAGAAILRVLQALSTLTSVDGENNKEVHGEQEQSVLWDLNLGLEPLWQELSDCISTTEAKLGQSSTFSSPTPMSDAGEFGNSAPSPPLPPGTQRLLPFIESFFVLCEKLQTNQTIALPDIDVTAREVKEFAGSSLSPSLKSSGTGNLTFARVAEKHRRLLNVFIRQNPSLLEKSLSMMLKVPRLIDFDNKRAYFRSRIRQEHDQHPSAPLRISVRRAYVLEDSYNQLRLRRTQDLKGRLTVQFQGEEGIDAGGLTREWYQLLSRVIFDKGALLFTTVGNNASFQPNPNSVYQTEHLSYFKFVGRVVAKALFDGQLLDVHFTRSFYKHILGVKVTYHDIEAVDPDYYKNLKWMLENDVSEIPDLTFSMDADEEKHILYEKNEVMDYELIPGGRNIRVTEETKHEYVDLVAEHILTTAIRPQINAFLEGFSELVPMELISIFNDKELELLISGLPEIDLDDLKANTEYTGYTAASTVIQWFWEVVKAFNKEDMARLLQFVTGTSKIPLEGFRALQGISGPQRFQIHKAYGAPERLPSAHTCFNQLDLPEYSSKEQLEERLLLAIHEASEGFGFG